MYLEASRNWDGRGLQGDHTIARAVGGTVADRLLHGTCNGERGDGSRDSERPAVTGRDFEQAAEGDDRSRWCLMAGW